ncbi:MAG: hypothetical protein ACKO57_03540 [Alphaproteobacteria bacterium]
MWLLPKRTVHALTPLKETMKSQDDDEYHRLLYVAMTRAEDALHIFGAEKDKNTKKNNDNDGDVDPKSTFAPWYSALTCVFKNKTDFGEGTQASIARFGALPEARGVVLGEAVSSSPLPAWVRAPAPVPATKASGPEAASPDTPAITLGLAIHLAMQHCLAGKVLTEGALRNVLSGVYPVDVAEAAAQRAWSAYQGQDLSTLCAQAQRVETEVSLRHHGKTLRLDALMVFNDHLLILDFKSGNPNGAQAQMDLYKNALCALYPHHRVETRVVGV